MDNHRILGTVKEMSGTIQKAVGALIGDDTARLDGRTREIEGQAERTAGEWLDRARNIIRSHPLVSLAGVGLLVAALGSVGRLARRAS